MAIAMSTRVRSAADAMGLRSGPMCLRRPPRIGSCVGLGRSAVFLNVVGWVTTIVMGVAAVGLIVTTIIR